jgi:hypothetical protein
MVDTVIVEADTAPVSAVSWPAIIAGGFVAAAMTLLLLALGAGIGFSVVSPWSGLPDITTTKAATVGGIFMAVTTVMSSALGGYITGRLRIRWAASTAADEVYFRDTAHGVLAWAFATVMGAALLASVATVVSGGAVAGAGSGAMSARDNGRSPMLLDPMLDRLFRPDYVALSGGTGQRAAGVFAAGRDLTVDRDAAARILRSRTEPAADDRQYLAQMVAARTGLAPADAERRVTTVEAEARAALDAARRAAMQLSFWLVASMLLGAFAAGLTATEGGAARDGRS